MRYSKTLRVLLLAGVYCSADLAARADESVTFQVDMSRYTNSAGAQVATVVDVRGGFNGWNSGWNLVNNGANVYTNTFTVTGAAATDHAYKFTYTTLAGLTWEDNINPPTSNDRHLILTGSAQTLPVVAFYAPSVAVPIDIALQPVTFTVDMNAQPSAASVYVRGDFNGWGTGNPLTNNGSGIWSTTINVPGVAGTLVNCKYFYTPGDAWEGGGDRQFQLTGGAQTLPLTNKWDDKYEYPSNIFNLTFQVDMTVQGVSFINAGGVVTASGGINGWGNTAVLTNNPALPYPSNWIYSGTWQVATFLVPPVVPSGLSGDAKKNQYNRYKYRANGGWEEPANSPNYSGNDRSFITSTPGDVVLPLVLYSDASLCDVLVQDTTVKFQLHLTNGTVATDGHVFDNTVDTVHINGESLLGAWQSWDIFLPQLNRDGTSDIYTNTFLIPAGRPLNQKVKYSVNGLDNEAPTYDDHIQWIRTTNTTYVMSVVEFGTNYAAARVQKQWGDLTVGAPAGGNVPVNWLGCPCVTLQSRTSVGSGSWINLPATESASSTNVPNTGAEQYFRLEKRITR